MFSFWTPEEIKAAILRMENQMTTGASQIATPTEGSATFLTRGQAKLVLDDLYWMYEAKTGIRIPRRPAPKIKTYNIVVVPDIGEECY